MRIESSPMVEQPKPQVAVQPQQQPAQNEEANESSAERSVEASKRQEEGKGQRLNVAA